MELKLPLNKNGAVISDKMKFQKLTGLTSGCIWHGFQSCKTNIEVVRQTWHSFAELLILLNNTSKMKMNNSIR